MAWRAWRTAKREAKHGNPLGTFLALHDAERFTGEAGGVFNLKKADRFMQLAQTNRPGHEDAVLGILAAYEMQRLANQPQPR